MMSSTSILVTLCSFSIIHCTQLVLIELPPELISFVFNLFDNSISRALELFVVACPQGLVNIVPSVQLKPAIGVNWFEVVNQSISHSENVPDGLT